MTLNAEQILDMVTILLKKGQQQQKEKVLKDWEQDLVRNWSEENGLTQEKRQDLAAKWGEKPSYLKKRDSELRNKVKKLLPQANEDIEADDREKKNLTNKVIQQLLENELKSARKPESPERALDLNFRRYIERDSIESELYNYLITPCSLLRIEGARKTGKTSLIKRIFARLEKEQNYRTVSVDFNSDIELKQILDFDLLLRGFCSIISDNLRLENRVSELWDEKNIGSKQSLKNYFQTYLLPSISTPIVIALERIDTLFRCDTSTTDFLTLLRALYELGKDNLLWVKLRFVMTYSSPVPKIGVNSSPFNVGRCVTLPDFKAPQVVELASRYYLNWGETEANQLISAIGGNPYCIRYAFYYMFAENLTLNEFLNSNWQERHPYKSYKYYP